LGSDELDNYYWHEWTNDGDMEGVILNQFEITWVDKDGVIHDVDIENLKEPERAKEEDNGVYIQDGNIVVRGEFVGIK
jgi:hypothetical protein